MPPTLTILAIGDELTCGERVDTNSAWIAAKAAARGARIAEHRTAADDRPLIADAIRELAARSDVLVVTGGLGPTLDDLTRHALGDVLGEPLVEDAATMDALRVWYAGRGRAMPDANRIQAMRPPSARCLDNPNGTAPGLHAKVGRTEVFCLPGPPREMMPMFERFVLPALRDDSGEVVRVRTVPTFGLGESTVADLLGDLMDRTRNPMVGTTASGCIVTCRIRYAGPPDGADAALADTVERVKTALGPAVLVDHDEHDDGLVLVRTVGDLLRERRQTVATVESCTGGLVGEMITRLPGSSDIFAGGLLTYSNELKSRLAGVDESLIARHGAVSREVAAAMARGGLDRCQSHHALAITGVAGPGGGSESKPVGTVWIARASRDGTLDTRQFLFRGGRDSVRLWSATTALGMLRLHLVGAAMDLLGQVEAAS
ncbi:MAG: CinA family nicotinamide mononucleotide deamidase-related protein [Planctomycetota bacterium]|nr:MAG: CinA family nicotinamide mononucleotide deamidase-related protein [Planctomycetota bacterium]